MLAHRERAHLVIIDIQDRLAPAIDEVGSLIANAVRLNRYAAHFDVPVILTEQMPDRIGATLSEIGDLAPPQAVTVPKSTFSCWRTDAFKQRMLDLRQQGRDQIIVAGMEALTGVEARRIHVDKGYRGHSYPNKFRVWISGQVRRVTKTIRREMKRRAAIEPVIGHVKAEHRMERNYLKGRDGDRANAVLAAAGYNFSLLLRWFETLLRALIQALLRTVLIPQTF